jgi:hypothetical protein
MPTANAATIAAGLLILVLLLLPTAFGAALLLPTTAVSRIATSREGHTASPIPGEAGTGTRAAPGCVAGQGTGSSRDTGFWHDVPDISHWRIQHPGLRSSDHLLRVVPTRPSRRERGLAYRPAF